MAAKRTFQPDDSTPSEERKLIFDEIYEESIDSDTIQQHEKDNSLAFCDRCFIKDLIKVIALYMCVVCEKYVCEVCFNRHNKRYKSHTVIRVKNESGENDGFDDFMSIVENESENERNESLRKTNVCVCDYVDTKHKLDKDCEISGFTGFANKWWVVCDSLNHCIKVFSLGSNVLQRYIRLGSEPFDVTEIIVENKTTEQDSAFCSEPAISGTDNKPDRKHLLAVTLPRKRLMLSIDLGKNPAVIHSKIKTERKCLSIDFYKGNIYTVCKKHRDPHYSVSILSVEGVTLKTFQTHVPDWYPGLTVLNGDTYMTNPLKNEVVCYNDEGRFLDYFTNCISRPYSICVDRSEDKVYILSLDSRIVCERVSDQGRNKSALDQAELYMSSETFLTLLDETMNRISFERYETVLNQRTPYMEEPGAMCFYSDKLYVGHRSRSRSGSHVTVVRLL